MVIAFAVVPDELDVIEGFLHKPIFISGKFIADCPQIHWVLDDEGVVGQAQG